jgi:2-aminoethylphosphonate transport system substrate-binding protein
MIREKMVATTIKSGMWFMTLRKILATAVFALALPALAHAEGVVTVYSADGLHDGDTSWFGTQFEAFTKATGIKVQYV